MHESRQGARPEGCARGPGEGPEPEQPRRAGWMAEVISSGLALILPALAFTLAAFLFYPPAARAMAPVAIGLTFVGLGLVLIGIVARRRL